jgi:3'(2'), 5'-bisphosphate nucleotidase
MSDLEKLIEQAKLAILEAGTAVVEVYFSGEFKTEMKPGETPVTAADRRSHTIISTRLESTQLPLLSEEGIHLDYHTRSKWEYYWMIDPLDGTKEFIKKIGEFTINIALMHQTRPIAGLIYSPCTDELYIGSKETGVYKLTGGERTPFNPLPSRVSFDDLLRKDEIRVAVSRSHLSPETEDFVQQFRNPKLVPQGSSLKFIMLLENEVDIYPRLGTTMEWDTAAAHAILHATNRGVYQTDLKSELVYNKPKLSNPYFVAY